MGFEAQEAGFIAKLLVTQGTRDIKLGTPLLAIVSKQESVAAFKDIAASEISGPAPAAAAPAPAAAPALAASAPPPPPPPAPTPAPAVSAPAPPPSAPATGPVAASPYAKTLAQQKGIDLRVRSHILLFYLSLRILSLCHCVYTQDKNMLIILCTLVTRVSCTPVLYMYVYTDGARHRAERGDHGEGRGGSGCSGSGPVAGGCRAAADRHSPGRCLRRHPAHRLPQGAHREIVLLPPDCSTRCFGWHTLELELRLSR